VSFPDRARAAAHAFAQPGRVTDAEKARALDALILLLVRETGIQSSGALPTSRQDLAREALALVGRLLAG